MPDSISSYRIEEEIARGGMGIVYRAVHTVFDEIVAIKAIFPELILNPELRERFVNEAKIQRRLQHPNIVQIREFLDYANKFYIIMEYIEGETLTERLKRLRGTLPFEEGLDIFRQALHGLAYAHSQGVIHRDIKPSNIIIPWQGVAKLTDFGIARAVEGAKLTQTGTLLGTPAYMAPEQIQGQKVGKAADIYSMGVTLYEMVTGRTPFVRPKGSETDFAILEAHIRHKPPAPSQLNPSLPPFVEAAIMKALAKKPIERFASCEDFEAALTAREASAKPARPAAMPVAAGATRIGFPPLTAPPPPPSAPSETQPKQSTPPLPARPTRQMKPAQPQTAAPPSADAGIEMAQRGEKLKHWIEVSLPICFVAGATVWYFHSGRQTPGPAPVQAPAPPAASAPVEQTPAKKKGLRGLAKPAPTEASQTEESAEPTFFTSNQDARYTVDDLKRLAGAGVSDQQIIRLMKKRGINFTPTPQVLEELRKGGVRESVLQALGSEGSAQGHP